MLDNLTVVIPYYNGEKTIEKLILSLPRILPIIIVDDQSDAPLIFGKRQFPNSTIKIIRPSKKGYFAGAANRGIKECTTDVLVLNQDVWFDGTGWYGLFDQYRDRYAMIGERVKGLHPTFGELGYIHGTFMYMRRDAINSIGLLNDKDYPLWGCTAEWQLRATRKGFEVLPLVEVPNFHHLRSDTEPYGSSIRSLLQKETRNKSVLIRTPPLLSVIVLCYNYGHYIKDCIHSLIGGSSSLGNMESQTLQSFEVIIVDDASTDNSWDKIQEVNKIEQGIRAYRLKKNVGTAAALNFGIERAVGKYVTFLSADDMRESFSLQSLVDCCEQNPHSFAYDDVWLFHTRQRIKKWKMEEYDFDKLLSQNQVHAGIMFPKEAWIEVGGYPAVMNDGREDWAFNIALGMYGWCGVHVHEFGYLYRREGQNRTETNTADYYRQYFADKIQRIFPKLYKGWRPMACCGGKGKNSSPSNNGKKNTQTLMTVSENGARMANTIGQVGMVKLEYLGKQVASTWEGEVTYSPYIFGIDRPKGWVDKRDAGEKGKSGFLNRKDKLGNYLFREALEESSSNGTGLSAPIPEVIVADAETSLAALAGATNITMTGTLSMVQPVQESMTGLDFPDPTDMNVEEIKRLELTPEQWDRVYKTELANRNRKGAIAFLEEKLASFQ